MSLFNRVVILGTGLIGGSLALGIRKRKLSPLVIGISRSPKTLALARKKGAVDIATSDINQARGADLLILATPVETILELAPRLASIISKTCIVIDVGSTKKELVVKLDKIFPNYLGTHPLAGSEKRGILYASEGIFNNALCILTPTSKTDCCVLKKIEKIWHSLGSKTLVLPASLHDQILSFTSHLPHVLAFALINTIPKSYFSLASSGLRDTTRIAASDSGLWKGILLSNRKNILKAIESFEKNLSGLKGALKKRDVKLLTHILREARHKREGLG